MPTAVLNGHKYKPVAQLRALIQYSGSQSRTCRRHRSASSKVQWPFRSLPGAIAQFSSHKAPTGVHWRPRDFAPTFSTKLKAFKNQFVSSQPGAQRLRFQASYAAAGNSGATTLMQAIRRQYASFPSAKTNFRARFAVIKQSCARRGLTPRSS